MTDHDQQTSDQHRQGTKLYQRTFDPETQSVSAELVQTVAEFTNTDTTELPALTECIDPDALNALFHTRHDGTPRDSAGNIHFPYDEYTVQIESDGTITILQPDPFPNE